MKANDINSHAGVCFTEVFLKAKSCGFKVKEIPVEHLPRIKGRQTGASIKVIIKSIIDLVNLKYKYK